MGFNALLATDGDDPVKVRLLLDAGSDPNSFNTFAGMVKNGPIGLVHLTPLMVAAPFSDQEIISLLIKAGARVNETDNRKMTPLMLAIATDHAQPATVRKLLEAGADVEAKDALGNSVLDWANKFQNPEIVSMLVAAGAHAGQLLASPAPPMSAETGSPASVISRSLTLFGKSDFFRAGGGCAGCHHQPIYARAYAAVRDANLPADPHLRSGLLEAQIAERPNLYSSLPFLDSFGGDYDILLPRLVANAELGEPASAYSDLIVHFLASRQDSSGAWSAFGIARPPIEESSITRTAYAIKALTAYGCRREEQNSMSV